MAARKKPNRAQRKALQAKHGSKKPAATGSSNSQPISFETIIRKAEGRKLVLNLGTGQVISRPLHKQFSGGDWFEVRVHPDPAMQPDIVASATDFQAIPDHQFDAIWASHQLQLFFPHELQLVFKEFYRVMKPESQFLCNMADMQTVSNYVAHGRLFEPLYDAAAGPIAPIDIMYGLRKTLERQPHVAHRTAFTSKSIIDYLRAAGFTNIRVHRKWVDLWATAYKLPEGDPRKSDKAETHTDEKNQKMALPEPLPVNRTPHPGQFAVNMLPDELDIPPNEWEPLGLKGH